MYVHVYYEKLMYARRTGIDAAELFSCVKFYSRDDILAYHRRFNESPFHKTNILRWVYLHTHTHG